MMFYRILNLLQLLAFFLICTQCRNRNTDETAIQAATEASVINVDVDNRVPLLLSEIAVKVSYIILDSNPEASFGFVEKIVFFENLIFLSDERNSAAIYCFDTLGTYQFKISRKGRGPGEYLDIEDFDIDRENRLVLIYDREFGAMLEYDFTGKFIGKYTFSPVFDSFKSLNDHNILAYTGYSVNPNIPAGQNTLIFSFDYRDIKSAKAYLAFNEELELYKKTIGPISDVSHSGDITYIYDFYTNSIYSFKNSTLTKTWSIDYGNRNIPESFWRNADFLSLEKGFREGSFACGLGNFQVVGKWIVGIYSYKLTRNTFIYNSEEGLTYSPGGILNDLHSEFPQKTGFPLVMVPPLHSDGKRIVSVIEPMLIQSLLKQDVPQYDIPDELAKLDINSNPVLQIIELK